MHGFRGPGTIYYTIDKQLTRHFRRTNLMASLYTIEISRFQFVHIRRWEQMKNRKQGKVFILLGQ